MMNGFCSQLFKWWFKSDWSLNRPLFSDETVSVHESLWGLMLTPLKIYHFQSYSAKEIIPNFSFRTAQTSHWNVQLKICVPIDFSVHVLAFRGAIYQSHHLFYLQRHPPSYFQKHPRSCLFIYPCIFLLILVYHASRFLCRCFPSFCAGHVLLMLLTLSL